MIYLIIFLIHSSISFSNLFNFSIVSTDSNLLINSIISSKIIFKKVWIFWIPISFKELSSNSHPFFEHPVVKDSYKHNKDIAKRLGITLQDRPENISEIVDSPIGVNFVPYNNNGEVGAIHHSGIDDPNQLLSIAWTPMTESQAERIGFHEMLHRGYYSAPIKHVNTDFDYYRNVYQPTYKYWHWKTSKLLKPEMMDSYLGDVHGGEAGTNLAEVGKVAGVKMGEKWPGDEKFWGTLGKWPEDKKFMLDYLNTDTRAGRRHIWDAMAAKYFTIGTTAAFSNWLNNSKDKETKKPAL